MTKVTTLKVMTLNCASFKIGWAGRAVICALRILTNAPDVVVCTELYATKRGRLSKRLAKRYAVVATHMGKVIYVRKGRGIIAHKGSILRMHLGNGKHAVAIRLVVGAGAFTPPTKVVIVAAHLSWQISHDQRRERQTRRLIHLVRRRFADTPTIYAGDWNSSITRGKRKRDAVGDVFKARAIPEAYRSARKRENTKYNSANRYKRPAPASGIHLDRIFGSGVTFVTWLLDHYTGRYGSDHFGIVVTVRIPTQEGTT